jgi:hypothetical protein
LSATNHTEEQGILREPWQGVPLLQVAEAAQVTLEDSDKVVSVPGNFIATMSLARTPIKAFIIGDDMVVKLIIWMRHIALPVPHRQTRTPMQPGRGRVGTE